MCWSHFADIARSTERLYFLQITLVWLNSSVAQGTWTSSKLKTGTSHSSLTNFVNAHVFLMLESATLGTGSRRGLTSTPPPSDCWLCSGKDGLACSQPSSAQGHAQEQSAIQPAVQAISDAGNNVAIRPLDLTISNETGKYIIFMAE